MANIKITDLNAYSDPASTDVLPIVDVGADETKKVSIADLMENAGAGTEALPGIAFNGDPDTGIYSPGADTVGVSTAGTERLRITSAGNVGIGTSSPGVTLHLGTTPAGAGSAGVIGFGNISNYRVAEIEGYREGGSFAGSLIFKTQTFGGSGTAGTERMRIDSSGRVGIGTSSPGQKLTVASSDASVTAIQIVNSATGTTAADGFEFKVDTNGFAYINNYESTKLFIGTNNSIGLTLDTSNNVGIGTTSPSAQLDVASDGFVNFKLRTSGTNTATISLNNATRNYSINNAGGSFYIYDNTSAAERLRIDTAGNVGIGTTAPGARLEVGHTSGGTPNLLLQNTASGCWFRMDGLTAGSSTSLIDANGPLAFRVGSSYTERLRIDSAGRLLVGTSSARTTVAGQSRPTKLQIEAAGTIPQTPIDDASISLFGGCPDTGGAGYLGSPQIFMARTNGSTTGSNALVVNGSRLGAINFAGTDGTNPVTAAGIGAYVDGTPGANDMPGRLVFFTTADGASSPTERMRINSAGYMKASKTGSYENVNGQFYEFKTDQNDTSILVTNDHASLGGATAGIHIKYTAATPNSTTSNFLRCQDATAVRLQIRSNGGIENYQSNNVDLSDERTKRNIEPASSTWGCVQAWEVVNYNYIDDAIDDTSRIGVIAQQVKQHCPEIVIPYQEAEDAVIDENGNVVTPAKEERLGVREQQMMWMAIKALQEAQIRIEQLEAKVAALESA